MSSDREAGAAPAAPRGTVTHPPVHTEARLQAAVTVETMSTGLVAVQSRPPRLARALTFHWMAAG